MDTYRDAPTAELEELLAHLKVATPGQIRNVAPRARKIAGELPLFESVWVDALAHSGVLTPYQAAEINAGRGQSLAVGPFVLCRPLTRFGYARGFEARDRETGVAHRVLVAHGAHDSLIEAHGRLQKWISAATRVASPHVVNIDRSGIDDASLWASSALLSGQTADAWLAAHGRFSPEAVLHMAQSVCAGLAALEHYGITHGDVVSRNVILTVAGQVQLTGGGLRQAIRPFEGYAHGDLPPEMFDGLAPERVHSGAPVSSAADLFACGALFWQLLTGRPAFPGGNALTKLRALDVAKTSDVRLLAPQTPEHLAAAIHHCLARDPCARPSSLRELAETLGTPTQAGADLLATAVNEVQYTIGGWSARPRPRKSSKPRVGTILATAAVAMLAIGLVTVSLGERESAASRRRATVSAVAAAPPRTLHRDVIRATHVERDLPGAVQQVSKGEGSTPPLVLPAPHPLQLSVLRLQPGQVVCGRNGQRPQIEVPWQGLTLAGDEVCFEGVDFLWLGAPAKNQSTPPAIIVLDADRAEFRDCTFQCDSSGARRPAALRWKQKATTAAPGSWQMGELSLTGCIVAGTDEVVAADRAGTVTLTMNNCLYLAAGAILRLAAAPGRDDTVHVNMTHSTLRSAGPVVCCPADPSQSQLGMIRLAADGCVFAPQAGCPLLELVTVQPTPQVLASIQWTGQDSLLSSEAILAGWRTPDGQLEAIPEELIAAGGLVRSEITFAGDLRGGRGGSELLRWQGPISSQDPPGILGRRPEGAIDQAAEFDNPRE